MRNLCLLIVCLTLAACSHLPTRSTPSTVPSLDASLAADCKTLSTPIASYDAWLQWLQTDLLPAYADCAVRHRQTVEAWPKPPK